MKLSKQVLAKRARVLRARFEKKFREAHPTLELLTRYTGRDDDVQVRCIECSTTFKKTAKLLTTNAKTGCNKCAYQSASELANVTRTNSCNARFFSTIAKTHPHLQIIGVPYILDRVKRVKVKCKDCGHLWAAYLSMLMRSKHGCQKCTTSALGVSKTKEQQRKARAKKGFTVTFFGHNGRHVKYHCHKCDYKGQTPLALFTRRVGGCRGCGWERTFQHRNNRRQTLRLKGKTFSNVLGYEPHALRYLVQDRLVEARRIKTSKLPRFRYRDSKGKLRHYVPDMLVDHDKIIEVKSIATLGCAPGYPATLSNVKVKRLATIRAGYEFRLLVFNGKGQRLPVPADWHQQSTKELISHFNSLTRN